MPPPPLPYTPVRESFRLPPGANFGSTSGIAFNSKGNIFVLHSGPMPLMEFDADGNFIRGFGDGLFERPHACASTLTHLRTCVPGAAQRETVRC